MQAREISLGLGTSILALAAPKVWPLMFPGQAVPDWLVITGLIAGALLVLHGTFHGILWGRKERWAPMSEKKTEINYGPVTSYNQSGGFTGNFTINATPARQAFSQKLKDQLLAIAPKNKTVVLRTIGSPADQAIGDEVHQFLNDNGYTVERMSIGQMAPPPSEPYEVAHTPDKTVLVVAPSVK